MPVFYVFFPHTHNSQPSLVGKLNSFETCVPSQVTGKILPWRPTRQSGYKTLGYIRRVKYNVAHQSAVKPEKGDPGSIDKVQRAIPRWQGVSHLFERETDADPEWNRAFLAGWGKRVSSGSGSTHTRERERGGMKKVSKVLYPTLLLRFLLSPT